MFSLWDIDSLSPLSAGKLETDGTMHVTLCDFIESWEAMSATQKKSLTQRYESGCKCKVCVGVFDGNYRNITVHQFCSIFTQHIFLKILLWSHWQTLENWGNDQLVILVFLSFCSDPQIIRCTSIPCTISAPEECLWTDWVMEKSHSGPQAQHFACINRSDGSCAWYRGIAPPKKEFLDIEDP